MDDDDAEAMLLAVFRHYGLREPGYGERPIRCPVHDESNPSCSVNRAKGLFNCHACGAAGNAAQIVMIREGMDYRNAMHFIEELGVTVRRQRPSFGRTPSKKRGGRWVPPNLRSSA